MKIDLNNLKRKADAVRYEVWHADVGPAVVRTAANNLIASFDRTPWCPDEDDTNAEHIAANSPPVTLALIARIRELETALGEALDGNRWPDRSDRHRALLAKGAVLML